MTLLKRIVDNQFFQSLLSGILSALIIAFLAYLFQYYDIVPVIRSIDSKMDTMNFLLNRNTLNIENIQSQYIAKDNLGIELYVGINSELKGNQASVFNDNKLSLQYSSRLFLTNYTDSENYLPTIQLLVIRVDERMNSKSNAEIFISKDAASRLGLSPLS